MHFSNLPKNVPKTYLIIQLKIGVKLISMTRRGTLIFASSKYFTGLVEYQKNQRAFINRDHLRNKICYYRGQNKGGGGPTAPMALQLPSALFYQWDGSQKRAEKRGNLISRCSAHILGDLKNASYFLKKSDLQLNELPTVF